MQFLSRSSLTEQGDIRENYCSTDGLSCRMKAAVSMAGGDRSDKISHIHCSHLVSVAVSQS